MPEGHTLHRLAGELNGTFAGLPIRSSSPQGRFQAGAATVDTLVLTEAEAFGKHLFVRFADLPEEIHLHLGLYGRLTFTPVAPIPVTGAVRWRLENAGATADLRGPTACELLDPQAVDHLLARLGPDPIRADADPDRAWERIRVSRSPIAALLMDQSVVAGVGNIFRAEVLFRLGIDPYRRGKSLDADTWRALWDDLVELMSRAVAVGHIDTVRPEHEPEAMGRPPRVDGHGGEIYVYRRALMGCLVCGTEVSTATLAGRNLFWCPQCQPRR